MIDDFEYMGRAGQAHREAFGYQGPPNSPPGRDDLLLAARALRPDDVAAAQRICRDAATSSPLDRDSVLRAISKATGITLTTLRAQTKAEAADAREPDHLELARKTLDQIGADNVLMADGAVWGWCERGVWREWDDRAVKQAVQRTLDASAVAVSANRVNGVTDVFKTEVFSNRHEFNLGSPESVNCTNGELELIDAEWQLRPHHREHYRTTQIPVAYDAAAAAPMFAQFLREIFGDDPDRADKVKALMEMMGYTLMSHARHERFVMLIGGGANGKSVVLDVLEHLCGMENIAGVQPSQFNRSFQRAHLHHKLANIVTELKQGEIIADAELKAITSGEASSVEHKFRDPFVMRPYATCWFGTNHLPHTRDFSDALFRRATILTFNRTFDPHEQDPTLKVKLRAELPGILNQALRAYARATEKGFTQPASSEAAKKEWRLEADQVAQFVEDVCHPQPDGMVQSSLLFAAYQTWATDNGINRTMTQKGLRDRLTRLGFGSHKDRSGRFVTGLRL